MKKVLSFVVLFLAVAMIATAVSAVSSSELADKLYELAKDYGMTAGDRVQIERYVKDNNVSDADATEVFAKAEEAIKVMKDANVTNFAELTEAQKAEVKAAATEAVAVLDLKLDFAGNGEVKVVDKNNKPVAEVKLDTKTGKVVLQDTGSNNVVLIVSSVAVVALAAGIVARKKFANA